MATQTKFSSCLVVGRMRTGKTAQLQVYAYRLMTEMKDVEVIGHLELNHRDEILDSFRDVSSRLRERYDRADYSSNPILLIVDDFDFFIRGLEKSIRDEVSGIVEQIVLTGRKYNVFLFLSAQDEWDGCLFLSYGTIAALNVVRFR